MKSFNISSGGGRIAVTVEGSGPVVLCVPGMGESRASFRHLVPGLVTAGYQVAVMDLRGHGGSSTEFDSYDDVAAATDIATVLAALGHTPAALIGNSMGAAAGVVAAAENPDAINRLVLIDPFVRDHGSTATRMFMRLALVRPWGPMVWRTYYRSLFGAVRPDDHESHVAHALDLLKHPRRWRAFQKTARTSHAPAQAALPNVKAEVLVIMGSKDPDFSSPEAEAAWVAEAVGGSYEMIEGAGHYPMGEQSEAVLNAILPLLRR